MMKLMNKKLTKKGFTLAELLIVVAILAILVAVSIPIFTSKLHDAKDATDVANVRAAKAAAVVEYMTTDKGTTTQTYYYDAANGIVKKTAVANGYNKCTATAPCANGGSAQATADDFVVYVTISNEGKTVTTGWVAEGTTV